MLAAVLGFACIDTSGKWLNQYMDPLQTVWVRYFGSVVFTLCFVNPFRRPRVFASRAPGLQAARSVLLLVSTILNFWALTYLQLSEMSAISFSAPLMVALFAGPLLGEWAGPRRLAAIAVGFIGVLVITRPGLGGFQPAALLSLASACASAAYTLTTRMLASYDRPETTMVYSGLAGVVLLTPVIPFIWTPPAFPLVWGVMVLCGFAGAAGHWFLILACRHAPAPVIAPFSYTHLIWVTLFSYFIFAQVPDALTLVGAAIVIGSGLYLLHRERVVAKAAVSAHSLTAPVIDET
jgi:drug/metabolite transporter (DMT)-like permease